MPRVYSAATGLGFTETFAGETAGEGESPDQAGGFMASAGEFINDHKTAVIAGCAGIFALAMLGELTGRR